MGFPGFPTMDCKDFEAFPFTADLYTTLNVRMRRNFVLLLCDGD